MRLNIKQKLILAPILCLALFGVTVAVTYLGEQRLTSLNAISRALEQQSMHLQMLFRGTNEALLTEGTEDSVAIAAAGIAAFDDQHRYLLRSVSNSQLLTELKTEISPGWQTLRDAAQPFLQVNDLNINDDLLVHYGGFLVDGEVLLGKVKGLAQFNEILLRNSARQITLMVTGTTILSLLILLLIFRHLYLVIALPLDKLRSSMLEVSDGRGELLERIDRHQQGLHEIQERDLRQEIKALHHAFQFMLHGIRKHLTLHQETEAELHQLNQELEQRVEGRTHELLVANERMRDEITQREKVQRDLEKAKRNNIRILEAAGEGILGTDLQGRVSFVNPAAAQMLGWQPAEMIGQDSHRLFHHTQPSGDAYPNEEGQARAALHSAARRHIDNELFWRRDGSSFLVEYVATPVTEDGLLLGEVVVFRDISERKRLEDEMRLAASIYQETPFGIMVTDPHGIILRINRAFTEITGYSTEEAVGQTQSLLQSDHHQDDFHQSVWQTVIETGCWQGEIWNRHKDGRVYPEWRSISAVRGKQGEIIRFVSVFSDISEKKLSEERIYHLAHYDLLTELPNRTLFKERVEQAMLETQRQARGLAVLFLDLDHFKYVNDTLGHTSGDQLLTVISRRIVDRLRPDDVVSRIGGDEFILLLKNVHGSEDVSRIARQLLEEIAEPVHLEGHQLTVSASIGISLYPDDGRDVATLHRNADTAMYKAKSGGKGTFRFFTQSMNQAARERLEMESELRRATADGAFELAYQPQVSLDDGAVIGLEALLRWEHPDRGFIGPDSFIPVAEDSGLIVPIGEWVLRTACEQFRYWLDAGSAPARFSVNLSARQFRDTKLLDKVHNALKSYDLQPEHLELELTESCVMEDPESSIAILGAFKAMGVQVAVDDFGIAYSSLSYLKRLPIDRLKIDRSFIRDIPQDSDDVAITSTIIAMSHNLGLKVIAEGVETEEQLAFLREKGCDEIQGYLFSRPLNSQALGELLTQKRRLEYPNNVVYSDFSKGKSTD